MPTDLLYRSWKKGEQSAAHAQGHLDYQTLFKFSKKLWRQFNAELL